MEPIWKDYYVMLEDTLEDVPSTGLLYRIEVDGTVVFTGRAFAAPDESELIIRINDVLAAYLRATMPLDGVDTDYITVRVFAYKNSEWVRCHSAAYLYFRRDWSYDPTYDDSNPPIRRVLRRVHPLQYLPVWSDDGVFSMDAHYTTAVGDYNLDYNGDYFVTGEHTEEYEVSGSGQWKFVPLATYLGADSFEANGETYTPTSCCSFILYYLNAYGGWDFLPVEGKAKESDTLTRYTNDVVYNNQAAINRGRFNYVNELAHKYTFFTGWLTEQQSADMHHLLNSPLVYVHDIKAGVVRPLVLTGTNTEHKNGRLNQYTIEAQLAQERIRR